MRNDDREAMLEVEDGICHPCYSRKGIIVHTEKQICEKCLGKPRGGRKITCAGCGKVFYGHIKTTHCASCKRERDMIRQREYKRQLRQNEEMRLIINERQRKNRKAQRDAALDRRALG